MRMENASSNASGVGLDRVVDNPITAAMAGASALLVAFAIPSSSSLVVAALAGGAAYAAASLLLAASPTDPARHAEARRIANALVQHGSAFAVVYSVVFLAHQVSDAPQEFFCASTVPWSPAIFAGGAYVLAVLSELGRRQNRSAVVHVIWVGIAWIAPWYGFFNVATVTGAGLALACEGRSLSDYAILAVMGATASIAGTSVGRWLAAGLPNQPINPYQDL